MAQQDNGNSAKLAKAKGVLAGAKSFSASADPKGALTPKAAAPTAKAAAPSPTASVDVNSRAGNIAQNRDILSPGDTALPKLHNGGPVLADGAYQLKAGEHVLTAPEAKKARKHALMAAGMKSLANPGKASPVKSVSKKPSKGVSIRPNKTEDDDAPVKLNSREEK